MLNSTIDEELEGDLLTQEIMDEIKRHGFIKTTSAGLLQGDQYLGVNLGDFMQEDIPQGEDES